MKENNNLVFDDLTYQVTKDNQSVNLNPLSFKLLYTLAQTPLQVVPIKTLIDNVWSNTEVSPDTLKQRVFVLRKSLEQSSIEGLSIQAVRGEGYRLLIEPVQQASENSTKPAQLVETNASKTSSFNKKTWGFALALVFFVALLFHYFAQPPVHEKAASNNRIALWSNMSPSEMPNHAAAIYQTWNQLLNQENQAQNIQLILSNQRHEQALPVQARKDRIALISYLDVITVNNRTIIKLSLVEPTTATILRTDTLSSLTDDSLNQVLQSQLNGINALITSGKLYLNKQQREFAKDPIWPTLKALANPS